MGKTKKKKAKKKSLKGLKNKAWNLFSIYIRLRDSNNEGFSPCCTCGKVFHWSEMDAGHYISRGYLNTFLNEKNVFAQCRWENRYREGATSAYAIFLVKKFGNGIIEELDDLKNQAVKFSQAYYEEKIEGLKIKIEELKISKGIE